MKLFEEELLKLVGDKLSANDFQKMLQYLHKVKLHFNDDLRIEIQKTAQKVGTEITGSDFAEFLNNKVAPRLGYYS